MHFNLSKMGVGLLIFGALVTVVALVAGIYLSHSAETYCSPTSGTPNLCRQWTDWVNLGSTTMWIGIGFAALGAVFVVLGFKFKADAVAGAAPGAGATAHTTVVFGGMGATPTVSTSSVPPLPTTKCANCGAPVAGAFCASCGAKVA